MDTVKKIQKNTLVAVMSCNRGIYLDNCISSIKRNMDIGHIRIYDDDSNDPDTLARLKKLNKQYPIHVNRKKTKNTFGGLYFNMNSALHHAIRDRFDYIFFIQDDMQIVRKCNTNFLNECVRIFEHDLNIGMIGTMFLKNNSETEWLTPVQINRKSGYYIKDSSQGGIGVAGFSKVETLVEKDWKWDTEMAGANNGKQAAQKGLHYVTVENPIMMYLPWPKTFRDHPSWGENFLATMADKIYQADFYPYRDMTVNEADELINRTITDLPIAEKYLEVANRSPRNFWQYKDSLTVLKYDVVSLLKKLKLYSFYRVLKLWITK